MTITRHSVFIVDDDADDRESIRDAFMENKHHYDYLFMHNGHQLLQHLSPGANSLAPSIILLDLNMPGMDGKDVLKELKNDERLQSIPVIVFTTSSSYRDRQLSYQLGASCFVTKPGTYRELISITDSIARLWLHKTV